jgi:hypothetical protein
MLICPHSGQDLHLSQRPSKALTLALSREERGVVGKREVAGERGVVGKREVAGERDVSGRGK